MKSRSALALLTLLACTPSDRAPTPAFERARAQGSTADREWRTYLGDRSVSHYSPLDQIDRDGVASLEVAWSYDAGEASEHNVSQIQFNPLVVKGVLYGASPSLRLFALDAASGEELWSFRPDADPNAWNPSRGVVYWEDGDDERLLFGAGPYLHAVDARTGLPIDGFGDGGRVDLRKGLGRDVSGDLMGVVATSPGTLFEDLLLLGARVNEIEGAAPGHVRAFDVRTGEIRWTFHTIPQPGEAGHETWPAEAWRTAGGANTWAGISVDQERGLAFVPTGSATPDFFGGARAGDDLFANTLLALDARTGERRWHFQVIRHDMWDRDLPAPPNLVTIQREGIPIPAVAQLTKTGDTFLFHRETGEPLFPLREEPVQTPSLPGEVPAESQPLPTRPPAFVRQRFSLDSVTDRSPEAAAAVTSRLEGVRFGSLYTPPSLGGTVAFPGLDGGAEWGGGAWDAETGLLFVNANDVPWVLRMVQFSDDAGGLSELMAQGYLHLCSACHGLDMRGDGGPIPSLIDLDERMGFLDLYRLVRDGRGRMPGQNGTLEWWQSAAIAWWVYNAEEEDVPANWARRAGDSQRFGNAGYQKLLDAEGLPGAKPPWGTLTALDLSAGEIRWQVPLGDYPKIREAGQSGLGAENYGGAVVTAGGLLFLAATPDERFRAFDKLTGEVLWEAELPASGFATPATYEAKGRQFVVIAAGGGKLGRPSGSHYIAFALPEPD
ncbi:MAG: PQQ-binding-like beta-propeller repeat protein [bacterium]|nr:PQQ-binding-like beta-propeller repeat protein [bacterium]